ncbi:MAG: thiamine pyrophosphate-binding protein, partial [Acidimicrobiia bacterium]|nr:thiamine pyrophosphate-binding protein [Acidimicrobiia bacterium]
MVNNHGTRYVSAPHEASAVLMAIGYARASQRLGFATVTHGPGFTNTITPLVEGVRSRTAMVVLTGETAVSDRNHLQKIGTRELCAACGAGYEPIRTPATIAVDVATAVRRAHAEQRPIVLAVPYDYEFLEVETTSVPRHDPPAQSLAPDPAALDKAVGIIAASSRPIVLGGRGAALSGARESLLRLAARIGAPVATTVLGQGLFRGDPFDIGIFGTLSNPVASEVIDRADCVIAFGAGLNFLTTDRGALLEGKAVVQVDIDVERLGDLSQIDAGIIGDATLVADTIVSYLDQAEHKPSGFRSPELEARLHDHDPAREFTDCSNERSVDPRTLTLRLDEVIPADRTVVVDAGRYMRSALKLAAPDPLSLVTTHAFGSIGLGMATAIGAAVAHPDRPTVMVAGDGGFMMGGILDINTAVQNRLDLIVVIYNDGSYGAEHIQFHNKNMDPALSLHRWPSFAAVAQSMGATGVTINNLAELERLDDIIRTRSGVVLVDVQMDPGIISEVIGGAH